MTPYGLGRQAMVVLLSALGTLPALGIESAEVEIPNSIATFLTSHCVECHGPKKQQGDLRLDAPVWHLTESKQRQQWELVQAYVAHGDMPPKKARRQPSGSDRKRFLDLLGAAFLKADRKASIGGTPLRRLNRVEYLNTVRDLFGIRMIKLPVSFPEDSTRADFDTMPEGLFLSPAVMEGYHDVATTIAGRVSPLPNGPTYQSNLVTATIGGDATRRWFGPKREFLKFTGFNHSGWVGGLWDSLFVAPESGVYRVRLLANAQAELGADHRPLRLSFFVFDPTEVQLPKRYRVERATQVAEVEVPAGKPTWVECDVPVEAGETFHVYCSNRFAQGDFPTGDLNRAEIGKHLKALLKRPEPTIELRGMRIDGPIAVPPRVQEFFGHWPPRGDRAELESKLRPLAERAFRRRITDDEANRLIDSVLRHGEQVEQAEFVWHYAIRRLLCSPEFLYRESGGAGPLSEFELASRLSYFLWSTMPDDELLRLAEAGRLSDPTILSAQTRRLLRDPRSKQFVKHFAGQWLGNRRVATINVCDSRYPWDDNVRYGYIRSSELFFEEVLQDNLPISTFLDSDFTYANSAMRVIWGLSPERDKSLSAVAARQRQSLVWPEPERISLVNDRPGIPDHVRKRGGVLGLPGALTITGDGVESSPILRGVWVLENLFGQRPPPPPADVPALDVDTSRATTVRETLAAHQKLQTCAKCHRDIDPFGLALENYDAIGGWRDSYAGNAAIDANAVLPDGTRLSGPQSIKQLLLARPEIFTRCLLTKLLEYGAGRQLSVGDQRVVDELVEAAPTGGYRFQDLVVAVTTSNVFLTR